MHPRQQRQHAVPCTLQSGHQYQWVKGLFTQNCWNICCTITERQSFHLQDLVEKWRLLEKHSLPQAPTVLNSLNHDPRKTRFFINSVPAEKERKMWDLKQPESTEVKSIPLESQVATPSLLAVPPSSVPPQVKNEVESTAHALSVGYAPSIPSGFEQNLEGCIQNPGSDFALLLSYTLTLFPLASLPHTLAHSVTPEINWYATPSADTLCHTNAILRGKL
jgi:hypothetical protein